MNTLTLIKKKISHTRVRIKTYYRYKKYKKEILRYYNENPVNDKEINIALDYLYHHRFSVMSYPFKDKYDPLSVKVFMDKSHDMYYVVHNGRRLYCTRSTTYKGAQIWYSNLLIEQDMESPHRYLTNDFDLEQNDIFVDVGSAEGILGLDVVDKVKKVYLFEYEDEWIEALKLTFAPWKEKVVIVKKYVSDNSNGNNVALDDYFENESLKPTFFKIDVEGAEMKVLNGMKQIINSEGHKKLAICTYHKANDYEDITKYVSTLGCKFDTSEKYMLFNVKPYFRRGLIRVIM